MGTCGAKRFFAILAKLQMAKTFTWPTAAIDNNTNWDKKWTLWLFLIRRLSLLLVFRMFNLTFHQDKKCLVFFSRKNITQSLYDEIVRYKCNLLTKFYFLNLIIFSKYKRIIKHALLGQSGHTGCTL